MHPFILRCTDPAILVLLIYSSLGYGTSVPTPRIAADFALPFVDSSLCDGFLTHVLIQSFFQQIPVTAFTTTSFTWWPGATKFISVAVQPFVPPHRLSVSPILSAARLTLFQADQRRTLEHPR